MSSFDKAKQYSVLVSSSFVEIRNLQGNTNISQILEKEKSAAIQSTLDAQANEIDSLRQENQILSTDFNNSPNLNQPNLHEIFDLLNNSKNKHFSSFDDLFKLLSSAENERYDKIQQNLKRLYEKIIICQKKTAESKEIIINLRNENNDLKDQNGILKKQIFAKNEEINTFEAEKIIIQSSLTEKDTMINALQLQIINIAENNKNLLSLNKNDNKTEIDSRISEFQKIIKEKDDLTQNLQQQLKDSIESINGLTKKIEEKDEIIYNLQQKDDDNDLIQKLQQKENEMRKLISKDEESSQKIIVLSNQVNEWRSHIQQFNESVDSIQQQMNQKDNEIESLKHQAMISLSNEKTVQIQNLSSQINSLIEENKTLSDKLGIIEAENKRIKKENKSIEESKSLLNNTILSLGARIEELESLTSSKTNSEGNNEMSENEYWKQINKLNKSIEETRTQHMQQIKQMDHQNRVILEHSDKLKKQLVISQNEKIELEKQVSIQTSNLKSLKSSYSMLEARMRDTDMLSQQQDEMIQRIVKSKEEIKQQNSEMLQMYENMRKSYQNLTNKFSTLLSCNPEEIETKITESLEKLVSYQQSNMENFDIKREIILLRRNNNELQLHLQRKEEQLQSTLQKITLAKDGKESELVKKFNEDFRELNNEHSKLIEEHNLLRNKLFNSEAQVKEIESKLIDQEKINNDISKRTEKYDYYEYISIKFVEFLSKLSSNLIGSLIQSTVIQSRLQTVDRLLVQLKKKHFMGDTISKEWNNFFYIVLNSLKLDPINLVQKHAEKIDHLFVSQFNSLKSKINENEKKLSTLICSDLFRNDVLNYRQKQRKSLYERSLATPNTPGDFNSSFKLGSLTPGLFKATRIYQLRNTPSKTNEPKLKRVD